MSPLFSKRDRRAADQAHGFAVTFARHPARPRRGLVPGRRVWTTILTAGALAGLGVVAVPLAAELGNEPQVKPVARNAPAPPRPQPTVPAAPRKRTGKPAKRAKPPVVTRTKLVREPASKPRKKVRRLPQGPRFGGVKGVVMKNVMTGMCADIPSDSGDTEHPAMVFGCAGSLSPTQRFDLLVFGRGGGPGGADLFVVHNSRSGLCFDLSQFGSAPDTDVRQGRCNPGKKDNQMWYLERRGPNRFFIRNLASGGRCLDVSGSNGNSPSGARLRNAGCSEQDDHLWSFY